MKEAVSMLMLVLMVCLVGAGLYQTSSFRDMEKTHTQHKQQIIEAPFQKKGG